MKKLDLIGKRFGRLLVIADAGSNKWGESIWQCKCDCGDEKIVRGKSLANGFSKSCGCLQKELLSKYAKTRAGDKNPKYRGDLTSKKFNYWTVLGYIGSNKNKKSLWKCRCECGNEQP